VKGVSSDLTGLPKILGMTFGEMGGYLLVPSSGQEGLFDFLKDPALGLSDS
jgi:hypothetical protein